jgi:hypothetical protein
MDRGTLLLKMFSVSTRTGTWQNYLGCSFVYGFCTSVYPLNFIYKLSSFTSRYRERYTGFFVPLEEACFSLRARFFEWRGVGEWERRVWGVVDAYDG